LSFFPQLFTLMGMTNRQKPVMYELGAVLTPAEMTGYCLRYRARSAFGILDEEEIKQTISYAADYWQLEKIDISEFGHVADPDYPNRSAKAHPIVHYFNGLKGKPYCEVLDGLHRIGMARAQRKRKLLAWVGHLKPPSPEERRRRPRLPYLPILIIEMSPRPRRAAYRR
jgi:hypothetical protein